MCGRLVKTLRHLWQTGLIRKYRNWERLLKQTMLMYFINIYVHYSFLTPRHSWMRMSAKRAEAKMVVCGSLPMSWELPHMKGRNWKSSSPHTPWLPAGSMRYVFCSFRITHRYLDQSQPAGWNANELNMLELTFMPTQTLWVGAFTVLTAAWTLYNKIYFCIKHHPDTLIICAACSDSGANMLGADVDICCNSSEKLEVVCYTDDTEEYC